MFRACASPAFSLPAARATGGVIGPAWLRGEIEEPQGEETKGSGTARVYTSEQQLRLGVDKEGQPASAFSEEVSPARAQHVTL